MKTRDEVIGSVVERVIPEGWHAVRNGPVGEHDLGEWDYREWGTFSQAAWGRETDANGVVYLYGQRHLVIRQDAPEPVEDVEKLKATIAERDETIRWYKQLESQSKARIAELEKERDAANAKLYSAELATSQHEMSRALCRGDALEAERKTLRARIGALETLCSAKDAEIDALKKERTNYKLWHGELAAKVNAVKKAWEGS